MLQQAQLISLLDRVLNQNARIRKGNEAVYFCPFCDHYKKKMEVNVENQNWHCWVCHARGTTIRSLFKKLKVNQSFYVELYKITKGGTYKKPKTTQFDENLTLPAEFLPLTKPSKSLEYGNALSYLKKRGVTRNDIIRYNIGYCEDGEYRHRVITPSYDKDGNVNFFSARAYYDNSYKYMLPPWSKDIVGFELFINWSEPVTLTEGTFDAFAIRKNAIPLFGTTMSDLLMESMVENGVCRVNIVLDDDALKNAIRIFDSIEKFKVQEIDTHLIKLEDKDPSVLGFERINEIINQSKPTDFSDMIKHKLRL